MGKDIVRALLRSVESRIDCDSEQLIVSMNITCMTGEEFRAIALSLLETVESSHMGHPDFRVRNKIFATLDYPSPEWAVVVLTPAEQKRVSQGEPDVFVPSKGAWGRAGSTQVYLR